MALMQAQPGDRLWLSVIAHFRQHGTKIHGIEQGRTKSHCMSYGFCARQILRTNNALRAVTSRPFISPSKNRPKFPPVARVLGWPFA
jgi:hypothetical protein